MSVKYIPIIWNPFKTKYDVIFALFVVLYLTGFISISMYLYPQLIIDTIIIRSFGTLAILILHIILAIGPLSRINKSFLPILYNRRHLGVSMFLIVSVHAVYSIIFFHGYGVNNPLYNLFTANTHYESLTFFPFQILGFFAYLILMVMAFTSHDFWLNFLSPKVWKAMHMIVYIAYGLVIMHVVLGIIQYENSPILFSLLFLGLVTILSLHIISGYKEYKFDKKKSITDHMGWVYVCTPNEIDENCAKMVTIDGERIAVFKYGNKLSAVHNVCKHQNGPLGEGKIVDGCITCPWHGYQYLPDKGRAPEPFTELLATYELKLIGDKIYVNPKAFPEGTAIEPTTIPSEETKLDTDFFIGWLGKIPNSYQSTLRFFVPSLFIISILLIVIISNSTNKIRFSSYDYYKTLSFEGELLLKPFPMLRVLEMDKNRNPKVVLYPLVNEGKFGADQSVQAFLSQYPNEKRVFVQIQAKIIERDGQVAMELMNKKNNIKKIKFNASITPLVFGKPKDTIMKGQIIDPKCYLGVMNPGEGKPHRSCAINCIKGGIMPAFITENSQAKNYYILIGNDGKKVNNAILFAVAEPIEIKGKVQKIDNWNLLYIDAKASIKRLSYPIDSNYNCGLFQH
ncbi:Rieske 2Fe-2S domain-containing protein [Flavobacterium muglaense]|uniref:Ferric reductase-like transmembrane domain-containing protein n=1 Tax=Flavobacterium muglaense TaxID=2764716 RepID=A0A923N1L7_9FLAO|nr:Rieske 2Fe-2S domain-containing protein [Flavobacterium muglaense]MBC5838854.1 ferric reductase-like transmembrane domain-containing protein [Flavobacterium muglaense]MBC5845357.1 ferric reductase-like transmembrane domain-containing protein [Flavobacterium muglaense]